MIINVTPNELKRILEGLNLSISYYDDLLDEFENEKYATEKQKVYEIWSKLFQQYANNK